MKKRKMEVKDKRWKYLKTNQENLKNKKLKAQIAKCRRR